MTAKLSDDVANFYSNLIPYKPCYAQFPLTIKRPALIGDCP